MVKVSFSSELSSSDIDKWREMWSSSPNQTIFNSHIWFSACCQAFPHRDQLVVIAEKQDILGAVLLVENRRQGLTLMGRPYMDRASLLLERDFMSKHGHQLLINLVKKFKTIDLSELSEEQTKVFLNISDNLLVCSRKSSLNPRFLIRELSLASKEEREINRLTRRLGKQGNWSIEFETLNENSFARMLFIEQSSHKVKNSQAILHKPGIRDLFTYIGFMKKAYVIFLVQNNKDIAHLLGLIEGDTFLAYHMAYHKAWADCAPGKLLIYHSLPRLESEGFVYFDFSRGESMIKEKFCDTSIMLYGLRFFDRSLIGYLYYFLYRIEQVLDLLTINLSSHLPVKYKKQLRAYFYFWLNRCK